MTSMKMTRTQWGCFVGIFALGFVLRIIWIGERGIQYDDAFSVFLARRSLAEIIQGTAADTMPPLYYFLLHFWMQLGDSIIVLRSLSVLLSLGIIILEFYLVGNLFGEKAGLWAAFITAISPIQIYHAQDLRMYALLVFCQMSYLVFGYRIFIRDNTGKRIRLDWVGLILSGTAAMYTHNLAIFGLIILNFVLLVYKRWRDFGKLILAQIGIAFLSSAWLVMLPGQINKIQTAFWTPRPGFLEIFQAVLQFTVNLPLPNVILLISAVVSMQILFMVGLETWKDRNNGKGLVFLSTIALLVPVILFLVSYLIRPVFVPRGFLVASLGYYGLAGRIIAKKWHKGVGIILAAAIIIAMGLSLPYFYQFQSFPRSPYKQLTDMLKNQIQPGDVIVYENKLIYFPSNFYNPDLPQKFIADEPGSFNDTYAYQSQVAMQIIPDPDIASAVVDKNSVYFVVFEQTIQEYQSVKMEHPGIHWLTENYSLNEENRIGDLIVYHYER